MTLFQTIKLMLWYPKSKEFDYLIRIHILFGKFQNIYFSIHCKQIIDEQKCRLWSNDKQSVSYWKLTIRRWELYFVPIILHSSIVTEIRMKGVEVTSEWFLLVFESTRFFSFISMIDFFLLPVVAWVKVISPSSFPPLKYDDKIFETSNCSEDRH